MRRTIWIVLLAAGTVLGFGAGFAHLCGYGPHGHFGPGFYGERWGHGPERLEERAADACVRAAERVLAERHTPPPATPPAAPPAPPPSAL